MDLDLLVIGSGPSGQRAAHVVGAEAGVVREQLRRNGVGVLFGDGAIVDPHTVRVTDLEHDQTYTSENIVLAVGTKPARPKDVDFDDKTIIDSDGLLRLQHKLPASMTIVGGGVIGVEYASMLGALGVKVTVVDQRPRVLPFLDDEIGEAFQYLLRRANVTFRLREKVDAVERVEGRGAITRLASRKVIPSETL